MYGILAILGRVDDCPCFDEPEYTNPLVWQFWAMDDDGRLFLYREIYQPKRMVKDVAEWVKRLTLGEPPPVDVICDLNPEAKKNILIDDRLEGERRQVGRGTMPTGQLPRRVELPHLAKSEVVTDRS